MAKEPVTTARVLIQDVTDIYDDFLVPHDTSAPAESEEEQQKIDKLNELSDEMLALTNMILSKARQARKELQLREAKDHEELYDTPISLVVRTGIQKEIDQFRVNVKNAVKGWDQDSE